MIVNSIVLRALEQNVAAEISYLFIYLRSIASFDFVSSGIV